MFYQRAQQLGTLEEAQVPTSGNDVLAGIGQSVLIRHELSF